MENDQPNKNVLENKSDGQFFVNKKELETTTKKVVKDAIKESVRMIKETIAKVNQLIAKLCEGEIIPNLDDDKNDKTSNMIICCDPHNPPSLEDWKKAKKFEHGKKITKEMLRDDYPEEISVSFGSPVNNSPSDEELKQIKDKDNELEFVPITEKMVEGK